VQLRCRVDVIDADRGDTIGQIIDIHTAGMLVMSELPLHINAQHRFKLVLAEEIAGAPEITVDVESVWTRQEKDMGFYTTGFSVTDITEENRQAIEQLVAEYGISK